MGRDGPKEGLPGALCLGCQTPWHQQKGEPCALGILQGHWALAGITAQGTQSTPLPLGPGFSWLMGGG